MGEAGATVYAITTPPAASRLDDLGFWVDRLGTEDEPLTTDLYLLRDDRQLRSGFLTFDGNSTDFFEAGPASRNVLASTEEGLFVAVSAGSSVESYHFSGAQHRHNLKLVPSAALIEKFDDRAGLEEARLAAVAITPRRRRFWTRGSSPSTSPATSTGTQEPNPPEPTVS